MYNFLLELKHFGLEILVIQRLLEHIVLNNSECIFWYICTKIRKNFFLHCIKMITNISGVKKLPNCIHIESIIQ